MESWRRVLRDGVMPLFSTEGLEALRLALLTDSNELIQGATTCPPPLACVSTWTTEGACLITYPFWKADELETVDECECAFAKACYECDLRMGESASCRHLLTWFDEIPRPDMLRELLPEINRELALRQEATQVII